MKKLVLLLFFVASSSSVQAAKITGAKIAQVRPDAWNGGGVFFQWTGGTPTGTYACNLQTFYWVPNDGAIGTHGGDYADIWESLLSVALAAQLADASVTIVTDGNCNGTDYEAIRWIRIE